MWDSRQRPIVTSNDRKRNDIETFENKTTDLKEFKRSGTDIELINLLSDGLAMVQRIVDRLFRNTFLRQSKTVSLKNAWSLFKWPSGPVISNISRFLNTDIWQLKLLNFFWCLGSPPDNWHNPIIHMRLQQNKLFFFFLPFVMKNLHNVACKVTFGRRKSRERQWHCELRQKRADTGKKRDDA